ncbi:MAG: SDR family oxidoreductase [Pseudomonadota bacterium]
MPTVFVTGVNRGLGLELARQFVSRGWLVHGTLRSDSGDLQGLVDSAGASLTLHHADMTDPATLDGIPAALAGLPIDVLFLSAGTMGSADFASQGMRVGGLGNIDYADWATVIGINVLAQLRLAEALLDNVAASEQKKIVGMSSMLGSMGLNTVGGLYSYRASKAAFNAVLKSLAVDLAKRGITVAALHPGWVRTDMGGPEATLSVTDSARGLIDVIETLSEDDTGRFFSYAGEALPW